MNRFIPALIKTFLSVVLLAAAYWAWGIWFGAKEAAKLSCVASVYSAAGSSELVRGLLKSGSSRELTKDEVNAILSDRKPGDCTRDDLSLQEFHIGVGQVNTKSDDPLRVWVDGPDGLSGTKDDLIIPYEEMNRP